MRGRKRRRSGTAGWVACSVTLSAAVWVIGVAPLQASSAVTAESMVSERAAARWQALIGRDFDEAYRFLSPGYRLATPLDRYRGQMGDEVDWQGASVSTVNCEARACEVAVTVTYRFASPSIPAYSGSTLVKEKWVLADDNWWYLPER